MGYDMTGDPAQLKSNIAQAMQETCDTLDSVVEKVMGALDEAPSGAIEPGVAFVDSLDKIIRILLQGAVEHHCDIQVVVRGILVGAFRASDTVRQEAHKTLEHLVRLILTAAAALGADIKQVARALMEGVVQIAREEKLNAETALSEAGTSAVLTAASISAGVEREVRETLRKDVDGKAVRLNEDFLRKQKPNNH